MPYQSQAAFIDVKRRVHSWLMAQISEPIIPSPGDLYSEQKLVLQQQGKSTNLIINKNFGSKTIGSSLKKISNIS